MKVQRFSPVSRSARRRVGAVALGVVGQAALALGWPLFQACGSADSTGGERIVLHTKVELYSPESASFTTGLGWRVTLHRALLSTGGFAYFDGAPPTARLEPRRGLGRFFGVGVAFAHPGHYQTGTALGEMTEASSLDLLAGTSVLPDGHGVTGSYRSARFSFAEPPVGPFADELAGHVAVVGGTAELEGEATRHFRAVADFADVAASQVGARIDGCELVDGTVDADGTIGVRVDPQLWFNLVDFAELDPGSEDAPSELEPGTQPRVAFAQGLAQLSAYTFAYSPGAP